MKRLLPFIGTVLIVTLSMAVLRPNPGSSEAIERWFWANKTYSRSQHKLVAIGDSRIYRGFCTPLASTKIGSDCLNLGYTSASVDLFYLDSVDARINNHGIIVVGITPFFLQHRSISNKWHKNIIELSDIQVFMRLYIDRWMWRLTDRIQLNELGVLIKANSNHELFYADGWASTVPARIDTTRSVNSYRKTFGDGVISYQGLDILCAYIPKWTARGIQIYLVQPPISVPLAEVENGLGQFNEANAKARTEAVGGIWIDLPRIGAFQSYDGSHLSDSVARIWTAQVLDSIIALQSPKRVDP